MDKAFLIDLDGTIVDTWVPLPGAIEFINFLHKNNIKYFIVTNRVSKTIEQIETLLNEVSINISKERIINPIIALNHFLIENDIDKYFFVGHEDTKKYLRESLEYVIPDYVVINDFEYIDLSYELFNKIFQYINKGAKIITTCYSNFYASNNEFKMDTGIFVKMYELLTNKKAEIIGKPSPIMFKMALNKLGINANDTIVIGDDGTSDILGGNELGMETILVKTGIYRQGDEEKYKPTKVVDTIIDIIKK